MKNKFLNVLDFCLVAIIAVTAIDTFGVYRGLGLLCLFLLAYQRWGK
jgi:hypothetical protein